MATCIVFRVYYFLFVHYSESKVKMDDYWESIISKALTL